MDYYRLEYNESLGKFRYEPITLRNDERYGWETLSMVINVEDVKNFIALMESEFPNINSGHVMDHPKASVIKKKFSSFSGISEL